MAKQHASEGSGTSGFAKAQLKMGPGLPSSASWDARLQPRQPAPLLRPCMRTRGSLKLLLGVSRWFLFGFEGALPEERAAGRSTYAQDAANAGLATGEFAMGYYYEIGIHVPKDLREARKWYSTHG